MVNIQMALEEKGVLLTDPGAAAIFRQEVIKGGVEATELVLTRIVQATPVGQSWQGRPGGSLAKGWQREYLAMDLPFESRVFNPVPYGETVEKGSKPHLILPRNKKALAFMPFANFNLAEAGGQGTEVVVKAVHHPGTKGTHFVEKTLAALEAGPWTILWDKVADRIVERLS
ncbi:MAG: hypothetical protein NTY36_01265 [Deltaproteobacteria bacterium]|nr:hypothetical protein [Deltaproteobacteria bacterium]